MSAPNSTIVAFPATQAAPPRNFEQLWGKAVQRHGYAAVPTIMLRSQRRLGVNPTQFCLLLQLIEHWRTRDKAPFPTKQQLADRIGVSQSTIQQNMRELEKAGLVRREGHKTASGDWGANTYHLDGLVAKLIEIEPEFEEEKQKRLAARRRVETPKGKR